MSAWQLISDQVPKQQRRDAWRGALDRLSLPLDRLPEDENFRAQLYCLRSPLGIDFARISSSPQSISGRVARQIDAVWLILPIEGSAELSHPGGRIRVAPRDIVYGQTGTPATLTFDTPFEMLYALIPKAAVNPRLITPLSFGIIQLPGRSGIGYVLSGMLTALAETFRTLTEEELRPVDLALSEFLITAFADDPRVHKSRGAAGVRSMVLHRVCTIIETRLSNPNLTLKDVAREYGISARYLQKLFEEAGQTFSRYVRNRRLERSRADLINPTFAHLGVSQICFRWGFNEAAHFSRVFRKRYGTTARAYRRSALVLHCEGEGAPNRRHEDVFESALECASSTGLRL
jgi:AraC-like DNA-binding protein